MLWIMAIALLPGVGSLAYVVAEVLPELFRGRTARRAKSGVQRMIDPDRDLRRASGGGGNFRQCRRAPPLGRGAFRARPIRRGHRCISAAA